MSEAWWSIFNHMSELIGPDFWENNPNLARFLTNRMYEQVRPEVESLPATKVDMVVISMLLTEKGFNSKFFYQLNEAWAQSIT